MSDKATQRLIVFLQAKPDKLYGCLVSKKKDFNDTVFGTYEFEVL